MTKKKKRKVKRRIFLFFIIFGSIIGYLSYNLMSNIKKILDIRKEEKELLSKLDNLEEEENVLNSDIKKLEDPEYVAKYAREKYLYSKDGELIIRIPEKKNR